MRSCFLFASAAGAMFAAGCGGPPSLPTLPVTGTITYKSRPVENAQVSFMPSDPNSGKPATAVTDAQGRFSLETPLGSQSVQGALAGNYKVSVVKAPRSSGGAAAMSQAEWSALSEQERAKKGGTVLPKIDKTGESTQATNALASELPAKYADASTSGLEAVVKTGEKNDFPFTLTE